MAHYVKLNGEDLSRYSNKIESVGLRKCPYYHCLTKKVIDNRVTNIFLRAYPTSCQDNSWHRYGM